MKYKILAFNAPHVIVEYSTDDDAHKAHLNVRIDKKPDGAIPTGEELDTYILSFAPQLPPIDPFAGVDWSGVAALVQAPQKTEEQILAELTNAVQRHLDEEARKHGYDSILSLCSYVTSTNPQFAAEGQAGIEWRDAVWAYCWGVVSDVKLSHRSVPTPAQLIVELPVIHWPI